VIEVERRFLVADPTVLASLTGDAIVQGYLFAQDGYCVRVRRTHGRGGELPATLTAKGPRLDAMRHEFEVRLPPPVAAEFLRRAPAALSKTRYSLVDAGHLWTVDVFHGANTGLVVAELELGSPSERVDLPPWVGAEISDDPRYDNENLAARPHTTWS
jgi:adenylate cyclase